jgi:hypothetical protein
MKTLFRTLIATAALALASVSAHAGLLGSTISQCANSVYSGTVTADSAACDSATAQANPGSAVVGAGVEFAIGANRLLDFGDDTLTITYIQPVGSPSPDLFVFDLDLDITGLSLASQNMLDVTFTYLGDRLGVLVGSPLVDGTVVLNIRTGNAVPEPGSLALTLIAAAMLGIGATRRGRRA